MNKWVLLFLLFYDVNGIAVILQYFGIYLSCKRPSLLLSSEGSRVVKEARKQTVVVSCFAAPESLTSAAREGVPVEGG